MKAISTMLALAAMLVALSSCGNSPKQTDIDSFIAERPLLSLPLNIDSVYMRADKNNTLWTERQREIIQSIFDRCHSLSVTDPDNQYAIEEIFRIPSTSFGLDEQGNVDVILITCNSHKSGIPPRLILVTLGYGEVIDAMLLDEWRLIVNDNFIEFTTATIDATGSITLVKEFQKHPMPFESTVITHATYRINREGHFHEVHPEGARAVSHRYVYTDRGYLIDDFTWGKQPADSTRLPQRMNEKNEYITIERSDDGYFYTRERPYYGGELLYYLEQLHNDTSRTPYFHVEQKYEFRTRNNNTAGVWIVGSSGDDCGEYAVAEVEPTLLSFITANKKLVRMEQNTALPASIYSYYDAAISSSGTIALRGSALDLYLRPTKEAIIVDSLVFFDTSLDSLNNTYTTAAAFGRADLPGLTGKPNTLKLEELSETYLKAFSYHFRPLTELKPNYYAAADYHHRMEKYLPNIIRQELPLDFGFFPRDNFEDPTCTISDYLTSFFTSQGGMGERTDFGLTQLTGPYMMQTLLLVSCVHKDKRELYLYTMDQYMNVIEQLPICSIARTAQHHYTCRIEATAVNALTLTFTPQGAENEQMRVLTVKIDPKGRFVKP